jgi:alkanesulfonate monooxygenase SsuD/methylene tetrahydromethanopterin reductase-like flavin-dependent oxidoreductase (luciferase family)
LMNYLPPAEAAVGNARIDEAALRAGRDPGEIRRLYATPGAFTSSAPAAAGDSDEEIVGPPEHWVDVYTHLALDMGFSTFLLIAEPDPEILRTFIEDVAPGVRERVAEGRAGRAQGGRR